MDHSAWVGRTEMVEDVVDAGRVGGLHALLDKDGPCPSELPPLGHWLLAPARVRQSEIDVDGHPRRGGTALLPPIPLPRRMWAGSHVSFLAAIPLGGRIQRRSTIAAIVEKRGSTGSLLFVTLAHEIEYDGVTAIRERQDLVYREAAAPTPARRATDDPPDAEASRTVKLGPVALFRYSALTGNGHRIHYDRNYARDVECYPGLVVHGHYAATLLLDLYRTANPGRRIRSFAFRARSPLHDIEPFTLNGAGERLWVRDHVGRVAMTAEVEVD